jgi:hypothetical protein
MKTVDQAIAAVAAADAKLDHATALAARAQEDARDAEALRAVALSECAVADKALTEALDAEIKRLKGESQ